MRTGIILIIDALLLACCMARIPSLAVRPKLPFIFSHTNSTPQIYTITEPGHAPLVQQGDIITAWNGVSVQSVWDVEYRLAHSVTIGDIALSVNRGGIPATATIQLPPMHTRGYLLFVIITGCLTWLLAVFLLMKRSKDASTIYAHWAMIALAVSVITAWEGGITGTVLPALGNTLFFTGYMGVATFFYLLVSYFPTPSPATASRLFMVRLAPGAVVLVVTATLHALSATGDDVHTYRQFRIWFEVFHVVVLLYIITALAVLVRAFRAAHQPDERKKMQWILAGCIVGPMPFLLFTAVPDLVAPKWSIPEEYTLIPLGAVPLSFVIAIVRYQAFNIELLIRRSTTYALVIAAIVIAYALLVGIIGEVFGLSSGITSAGAAIATALLFEPLRKTVYKFVDERFFRVQYDFRTSTGRLLELLKTSTDLPSLGAMVIRETQRLVPVERIAVIALHSHEHLPAVVANERFEEKKLFIVVNEILKTEQSEGALICRPDCVEPGVSCAPVANTLAEPAGIALFFPIRSATAGVQGLIALGYRRSGARFSAEDVDLFKSVALQAGLTVDRILLEDKLRREQAESERLAKMSELKSDFVSFVSHEFRTPLTSIRVFAELLEKQGEPFNEKQQESLHVIEGEVERLNRMVTNILNASSIEANRKQYHLAPVNAGIILKEVAKRFEYELNKNGLSIDIVLPHKEIVIHADADALGVALGNLVDNAIKYSDNRKEIVLRLKQCATHCIVEVQDFGVGIPASVQPQLFDMFYREPIRRGHTTGWGLGLPLVKHIVNAHGGNIEVKSEPTCGTTISIHLPRYSPPA